MSDYYTIKKSEYNELTRNVLELMQVTASLRAELDAERTLNKRLMAMDFRPAIPPASPPPPSDKQHGS